MPLSVNARHWSSFFSALQPHARSKINRGARFRQIQPSDQQQQQREGTGALRGASAGLPKKQQRQKREAEVHQRGQEHMRSHA